MRIWAYIDYIWQVGESYHRQNNSPGDGESLVMWCWYLDAVLPLVTFAVRLDWGWLFNVLSGFVLLVFPFVFCRLRYGRKRQKAIVSGLQVKHPGRRLLYVWVAIVVIFLIESVLMVCFGLYKIQGMASELMRF